MKKKKKMEHQGKATFLPFKRFALPLLQPLVAKAVHVNEACAK